MYYVEGENYEHQKGMHPELQSDKHIHVSSKIDSVDFMKLIMYFKSIIYHFVEIKPKP